MANIIIVMILLVLVGAASAYIVKAKKSGVKCIGCPSGGACKKRHGTCSCGCSDQ